MLKILVKRGLHFMHGLLETGFSAKRLNELKRRAHLVEWRNFQQFDVIQPTDDTFVLVLGEQCLQYGTSLPVAMTSNTRFWPLAMAWTVALTALRW